MNSHLFSTLCGVDIDAKALAKAKSEVEPRFSDEREYEYFSAVDKKIADTIKNTETSLFEIDMCQDQLFNFDRDLKDNVQLQITAMGNLSLNELSDSEPIDTAKESKLVVTLIEVIEHIIEEKHSGLLDNLH